MSPTIVVPVCWPTFLPVGLCVVLCACLSLPRSARLPLCLLPLPSSSSLACRALLPPSPPLTPACTRTPPPTPCVSCFGSGRSHSEPSVPERKFPHRRDESFFQIAILFTRTRVGMKISTRRFMLSNYSAGASFCVGFCGEFGGVIFDPVLR